MDFVIESSIVPALSHSISQSQYVLLEELTRNIDGILKGINEVLNEPSHESPLPHMMSQSHFVLLKEIYGIITGILNEDYNVLNGFIEDVN